MACCEKLTCEVLAIQRRKGCFDRLDREIVRRAGDRAANQDVGIFAEVFAERQAVLLFDAFVEVECTHEEADAVTDFPGEAKFLSEGLKTHVGKVAANQVGGGEIGILVGNRIAFAICSDRCQREIANVVVDLS